MVETFWWLVSSVKTDHSVADVLKKVEKTSSENSALIIFEYPYRTCGSGGLQCKDAGVAEHGRTRETIAYSLLFA